MEPSPSEQVPACQRVAGVTIPGAKKAQDDKKVRSPVTVVTGMTRVVNNGAVDDRCVATSSPRRPGPFRDRS